MDTYFNRPKQKLIFVPKELGPKKLICIDEAGSVPFHLKKEIESFMCVCAIKMDDNNDELIEKKKKQYNIK